jgi:Cu/Ag efflux pump CusA
MRAIVGWSLRFRLIVLGVAAATMLFGVAQLSRAPVDVLPEFVPPYVEIQTEALGLSADEVEQLVTVPLEADLLHGVAFLNEIRSESVAGLSSIILVFDPGTDVYRARQMVAERLTQAHALPSVSRPPAMLQPLSSASRVLMVGLSSKDVSLIDMSVLARWTIRPRLLSVPGVANVTVWGQRERQLQVLVDPQRLRDRGVSLQQVIETAGNAMWVSPLTFLDASTPGTGGFIDTPNQRLGIQHILPIKSPGDMARVAIVPGSSGVQTVDGRPLQLGDVANLVEDHQPLIGDAIVNGGQGLMLVIEKFPGASTSEVTRGIEDALDAMRPGLSGIEIDSSVFRPATYIETATSNIGLALLIGMILTVVALGVLLRDWRVALIALVTIPLSLIAAGFALYLFGTTINSLVVAGLLLAMGLVIDDVVVGYDSVIERRRQPQADDTDRTTRAIVLAATADARGRIGYATVILGFAVAPVLFVGGIAGAFVPSVVLAYVLAVAVSAVVAVMVTPTLCVLLLSRGSTGRRAPLVGLRSRQRYSAALERLMHWTRPAVAAVGIATIGAVALFGVAVAPQVAKSPLPTFRESDLLIQWNGAPGTSHAEMSRIMSLAGAELQTIPGIRDVGGHVGRAVLSDQIVGSDSGELWLSLDASADYDRTVAAVQAVVDGYPGLGRTMLTYPAKRVGEVMAGTDADLVVRVYGQDLDILRTTADSVKQAIGTVAGVNAAAVERQVEEPTLNIQVDLAAAERHGIKPGDIRRAATTLLSGILVGSLFEDQKVFDVVVWGVPELRQSLNTIRDLLIDTPSGGQVHLWDVADVSIGPSPSVIAREGVFRRLDVSVAVSGRDINAVAADIHAAIKAMPFPLEYRAEILGGYAERQAIAARLLAAALAAAIGIFLLLQAAFASWRRALLVFITLPFAIGGGALAAVVAGSISLGTLLGFFTVLAIAVRNGILLVTHFQRLEREGDTTVSAFVIRGAVERLTPVLTTAAATPLLCLPFVILGDRAGYELLRPMSVVILGGIATSTLLSMFIVPALYPLFTSSPEPGTSSAPVGDQPVGDQPVGDQPVGDQPIFEPTPG